MGDNKSDTCINIYKNVRFNMDDGGLLFGLQNNIFIVTIIIIFYILLRPRSIRKLFEKKERKSTILSTTNSSMHTFSSGEMRSFDDQTKHSAFHLKSLDYECRSDMSDYVSYRQELKDEFLRIWEAIRSGLYLFEKHSGIAGLNYLRFLRMMFILLLLLSTINTIIVIPVTISKFKDGNSWFGTMTLSKVNFMDDISWFYVFLPMLYHTILIFCIIHWKYYCYIGRNSLSTTTLIVRGISAKCTKKNVMDFFQYTYGDSIEITNIFSSYDIHQLSQLKREKAIASLGFNYYRHINRSDPSSNIIMIKKSAFGCKCLARVCPIISNYIQITDAYQYYSENLSLTTQLIKKELYNTLSNPLSKLFVTFKCNDMMLKFFNDITYCSTKNSHLQNPPIVAGSTNELINKANIKVKMAPVVDNIIWKNLKKNRNKTIKFILKNIAVLVLLIFFTTPSIIINYLPLKTLFKNKARKFSFIENCFYFFIPTLIVHLISTAIQIMVDSAIGGRNYLRWSSRENAMFIYKYLYYLVSIFFVGYLGFSSIAVYIRRMESDPLNIILNQIKCIILPQISAYFISILITSFLFGEIVDFVQALNNLRQWVYKMMAKDPAEILYIKKKYKVEASWGSEYAWSCFLLTIGMSYAVTSSFVLYVITIGIGIRLFVVKYKMLYIYEAKPRHSINNNVTSMVVHVIILSGFLMHLNLLFIIANRVGFKNIKTYLSISLILFFILLYMCGYIYYRWRYHHRHQNIQYCMSDNNSLAKNEQYIPNILLNLHISTNPIH